LGVSNGGARCGFLKKNGGGVGAPGAPKKKAACKKVEKTVDEMEGV